MIFNIYTNFNKIPQKIFYQILRKHQIFLKLKSSKFFTRIELFNIYFTAFFEKHKFKNFIYKIQLQ